MKALLLTEGGKRIGFGHIARCVSLYQAFREKGISAQFLIKGDSSVDDLLRRNIPYRIEDWIRDHKKILEDMPDVVVIDSYLASPDIYKKFYRITKLCVYLDDHKRINYPPGIIVNGSIYAKTLAFQKKKNYSYLLGPQFSPLRKCFWKKGVKKVSENIKIILLMFGGYDLRYVSTEILTLLADSHPSLNKRLVSGASLKNLAVIRNIKDNRTELIYRPGAERLRDLMLEADVAISGGGQTLYELARVGVPTVGICLAENQRKNLEIWQKMGFLIFAGHYHAKDLPGNIISSLNKMDHNKRVEMSAMGRKYVDGLGALRIIDKILEFGR